MTTKGVKDEGENEDKETVARAADVLVTFLSFCIYFCKKKNKTSFEVFICLKCEKKKFSSSSLSTLTIH